MGVEGGGVQDLGRVGLQMGQKSFAMNPNGIPKGGATGFKESMEAPRAQRGSHRLAKIICDRGPMGPMGSIVPSGPKGAQWDLQGAPCR